MNRDAKTQSSLIALARTRRMQRALAHAYLHRGAPMPTLRTSLGFMMTTACVTEDASLAVAAVTPDAPERVPLGPRGHQMTVLGVSHAEAVVYVVEEIGGDEPPIVYRLFLRGPRHGHLVPIHAWYEHPIGATEIRARIGAIAATLAPVMKSTTEAWMLSTRVVQRRALRIASTCAELPIRKFALQLVVEPVSGHGPSGKTTVTAFLRPQAQLGDVWAIPGADIAVARVSYIGIPSGLGLPKDTVVLLSTIDEADSHV